MDKIKVSVIIPFHNGETYIRETMSSILAQSLKEIEIICVDDESTDCTYNILKDYAQNDHRIKALKQKKVNAGAARNLGRQNASGEYLLFLDSDDLFEPDLLEKMYKACKDVQADVCVCNADQYDTEKEKYIDKPQYLREKLIPENIPFSKETIQKYVLYFTTSAPWNKMVRSSFLNEYGIEFQEIERANDQYFSIMCLILAKRITIVREKLVHYRVKQKENLTTSYSETPLCAYQAMQAVKGRLEELKLLEDADIRCAFDNKILNLLLYSLNIQNDLEGYRKLYNTMKEEGFKKLGFEKHEEDYYFNVLEFRNLQVIWEKSCEEYLLLKNREYRETINRKNEIIKQKSNTVKNLQNEKRELQKKEKELNYIKGTKRYRLMTKIAGFYHKILKK